MTAKPVVKGPQRRQRTDAMRKVTIIRMLESCRARAAVEAYRWECTIAKVVFQPIVVCEKLVHGVN